MAYPTADGQPQLSGNYIPLLYATMLLIEFYKTTVFGAIANTEHEDQLKKFGDTLRIRTLPDILVEDYVKGQDLNYQTPDPGFIDLLIDKGKYWAMAINALDKKQSDIAYVEKWAAHASQLQAVAIDTDVLHNTYSESHASNMGATAGLISQSINLGVLTAPKLLSKANIVDFIVDCGVVLDEQNVPSDQRWLTLPAWACGLVKTSDLKDASLTGDKVSPLRNGRIGMIDRFEIYATNSLATVADSSGPVSTYMIFGQKNALTFASQMVNTETLKNPKDFGDLIRSLQAYGYKTIKPEAQGTGYIARA
jgi:hypothetical protein